MENIEDMIDSAQEIVDVADTTVNTVREGNNVAGKLKNAWEYKDSSDRMRIQAEIQEYDRRSAIVMLGAIFICVVAVVATIVLCIMGNDVILRMFGI